MNNVGILIPLFALLIPIVAIISKAKQRRLELELEFRAKNGTNADSIQMQQEVTALKERIAVLERLATDNNRAIDLDREIEKLR